MEKATIRLIIFSVLLFIASLVQFLDVSFLGVAPNAVLVILVLAVLFLRDIWYELFLLACASFLLKFSPIADHEILVFFIVGLLMISMVRKLPWHIFVNGIFLIASATLAMYTFIDPSSILSLMFVKELSYNGILMYVLYYGIELMPPFRNVR